MTPGRFLVIFCVLMSICSCGKGESTGRADAPVASAQAPPAPNVAPAPEEPRDEDIPTESDFDEEVRRLSPADLEKELDALERELGG